MGFLDKSKQSITMFHVKHLRETLRSVMADSSQITLQQLTAVTSIAV